jgi:hypothetical protein
MYPLIETDRTQLSAFSLGDELLFAPPQVITEAETQVVKDSVDASAQPVIDGLAKLSHLGSDDTCIGMPAVSPLCTGLGLID